MYRFSPYRLRLSAAACILATMTVSCAPAVHRPLTLGEKEAWQAIKIALDQEEAAIARNDIEGGMASMSPDFIGTTPSGRTSNYAQIHQSAVKLVQMTTDIRGTDTIIDLKRTGNVAVVTLKNHTEITLPIKNLFTGRAMGKKQDNLDRETWVKTPRGWLCTRSDILTSSSS